MFVDMVADNQREKIGDPLMTAEFRQRVRHGGKEADQKPDVHNASLHNSSLATISPWPLYFHYTSGKASGNRHRNAAKAILTML